jgi:hypothetical protein
MAITGSTDGSLGSFNVGLAVAIGLINPLSAQLDALLSIGLGPFMADLAVSFNASLALNATLSLQIGNPLAALQLAISALAQLQAALSAALSLPPIQISLSAEIGASAALAAALSARIGLLKIAIQIALEIKIGAVKAAAEAAASLALPGVVAISFEGGTLAENGTKIATILGGGSVADPGGPYALTGLPPTAVVAYGVLLACSEPSVGAALKGIISV